MSYKVNCALAIIPNADGVSGDWYGYEGTRVPEGLNDERCKSLLAEGLLAEVKDAQSTEQDSGPNPGTAEYILAEVGDDPEKAKAALDAEVAERGDKARKGLVKDLEAVIAEGGQGS